MFGKNPKRPVEKGDGTNLLVQEVFPTLQGEGPNVGMPAVFVRLGGCNLTCSFCDTEFESFKKSSLDDLMEKVRKFNHKLVVITGGEPLRQPIEKLCDVLIEEGYKVQVETNGTLFRNLNLAVEIICSPKNTGAGYFPIREDLLRRVNSFKFIISKNAKEYAEVPELGQSKYDISVFLQPMDEYDEVKNKINMAYAVELCMKFGYRLSLQTHKILGIE